MHRTEYPRAVKCRYNAIYGLNNETLTPVYGSCASFECDSWILAARKLGVSILGGLAYK